MIVGVTGWQGFIGSNLAKRLGKPVLFKGNLRDLKSVKAFVNKCDRIYHVAGLNRAPSGFILANNLVATGNIVHSVQNSNKQVIFISSQQVEWNAKSEYGFAKSIEEMMIQTLPNHCIFRLPNVYGPGCKPNYNSVVATFCFQIVHKNPVNIYDPNETREFIYIEDVVNGLLEPRFPELIKLSGETMSIGEVYQHLVTGTHPKLKRCLESY